MNEGYQDREDPGLTVRFPLVDRPGESLLVWTTTPWTLTSNVAAAVGEDLRYVARPPGRATASGSARARSRPPLVGPFEVLEDEVAGSELVGWRYEGPFDDLPAVRTAFGAGTRDDRTRPIEHRVVAWERGRRGRGHRHRPHRPGLRRGGLPARQALGPAGRRARSTSAGIVVDGFGSLTGRDVRDVADPIVEHLEARGPLLPPGAVPSTATRIAGAAGRRSSSGSSTSGSSAWARSTTSRASADRRAGRRQPALPDHGGRRPASAGSPTSGTSASSTGSATCTTG